MKHVIPANPGIYVLLVGPQHTPEDQDFTVLSNWCKATPVVAWAFEGDKCVACGPGYTDVTMGTHGDVFLFPDGQVFDLNHETTFPNLAAWIAMQFGVDVPSLKTKPTDIPAKPPKAPEKSAKAPDKSAKAPPRVTTTLRDMGISGRACAPLERMGVETLLHLAAMERDEVKRTRGVAMPVLKEMDALLEEHGLSWGMDEWAISAYGGKPEDQTEEAPDEDADEDDEDLL